MFEDSVLDKEITEVKKEIEDVVIPDLPIGYSIPMLVDCAIELSNNVVDHVPDYSTADHISIFKSLNSLLVKLIKENKDNEKFCPYYFHTGNIDSDIMDMVRTTYYGLSLINLLVSIKEKYYYVEVTQDKIQVGLSRAFRRSAMHLVSRKSEWYSYDESIRKHLKKEEFDPILLALSYRLKELEIFYDGMSDEWNEFLSQCVYTLDDLEHFQGFIAYLRGYGKWYKIDDLKELWCIYCHEYDIDSNNHQVFVDMIDLYTLTPEQAVEWGIPSAFILIEDWYIHWPFFFNIMDGCLLLISLFHRKKNNSWSRTLGSYTSKIASYLADCLPRYPNALITSEKIIDNSGDMDLVIYDKSSRHLLICEVKTVFDRFRTNYQHTNFYSQRVNVEKAIRQLRNNKQIIDQGLYSLDDIFISSGLGIPQKISLMILLWWDIFDPTIDTVDEEILCCNFKTFKYLYTETHGNISLLVHAINKYRTTYCPAKLCEISLMHNGEILNCLREVQTNLLPARIEFGTDKDSEILHRITNDLATIPDDWKEQLIKNGEEPSTYYFY